MVDGGILENVTISRVLITTTSNALFIRLGQRSGPAAGTVKGVVISDLTADIPDRPRREMNKFSGPWRHRCQTLVPASITGLPGHPVQGVVLRNVTLVHGGAGGRPERPPADLAAIPEHADRYPECTMFGPLPAWGLYCRHVEGLALEGVSFRMAGRDDRPAVVCDDVGGLVLQDLAIEHAARTGSHVVLNDVTEARASGPTASLTTTGRIERRGTTSPVSIEAAAPR